jgi:hypothetical protein
MSAFATLAAGGMEAGSSILSGFFGSNQAKNEQAVAKYNAALMKKQAEAIKMKTEFSMKQQAKEAERTQGELRASIGGSGTVATQGAPLLALALQKSESALQNYLIGYEGRVEANAALSQAQNYLMQAKAAGLRASQSLIGGFIGAGMAAFSALSKLPGKAPVAAGAASSGAASSGALAAGSLSSGAGFNFGAGTSFGWGVNP